MGSFFVEFMSIIRRFMTVSGTSFLAVLKSYKVNIYSIPRTTYDAFRKYFQ